MDYNYGGPSTMYNGNIGHYSDVRFVVTTSYETYFEESGEHVRPIAARPHNHVPAARALREVLTTVEPSPEPARPTARRSGCRSRGRRPVRSLPGMRGIGRAGGST